MRLGVNIDHVATVRQARKAHEPEPIMAALLSELAGANGITVHLRGDRRHIQERDLKLLRQVVSTKLNVEMAATREMVEIATQIKPDQVTLVPETPDELTTTGGLDVIRHSSSIENVIKLLTESGICNSLFIDSDLEQVNEACKIGAQAIEINTGPYAEASEGIARDQQLDKVRCVANEASQMELTVLAGHGLTYVNVQPITTVKKIEELNIGHSIISRAVLVGITQAVSEMLHLIDN